jgi:adenylate kinase
MILVILGAPGAGKGTIGDELTKTYKIPKISTGDILRKEVKEGTELGIRAKEIMEKGGLVDDKTINDILRSRINKEDCKNGFMLDGFPRTLNQAKELDNMLVELKKKIDMAVNLDVSSELIIKRLTNRRVCKKCGFNYNLLSAPSKVEGKCDLDGGELYHRADDSEDTIKNRLSVYARDTQPLIDYYKEKGLLVNINAESGVNAVISSLTDILKKNNLV